MARRRYPRSSRPYGALPPVPAGAFHLTPTRERPAAARPPSPSAGAPYVTDTVQHGRVVPGPSIVKPCTQVPLKPWHVEMPFIPRELGMGFEGPAIRFCIRGKQAGPLVHVRSPQEFQRLSHRFRDCVARDGARGEQSRRKCAMEITRGRAPFGGLERGRQRRR